MGKNNSKFVILMPIGQHVEWNTMLSANQLILNGYNFRWLKGKSDIALARSQMATDAIANDFEELLWIDSDTSFTPDDVERLRSHNLPIATGLCSFKSRDGGIAAKLFGFTEKIEFGRNGGLLEIYYAGCGFLYTKRCVYEDIRKKLKLPDCMIGRKEPITPYFMPMTLPIGGGVHTYLSEDFAFCERARQCGYKIYADTTINLKHIGDYEYSWEDMSGDRPRYSSMTLQFSRNSDYSCPVKS